MFGRTRVARSEGYRSLTPRGGAATLDGVGTLEGVGIRRQRRVLIVTYPGTQALDVVGPFEVFVGARQVLQSEHPDEPAAYDVRVVSAAGTPVLSESGLSIGTDPLPDPSLPIDTVLLAGGVGVQAARADEALVGWLQYVERVRVEAAQRQLEDTTDTVVVIARRCGFGTAETMRRSFLRRLGVSPDHYRRRFGSAA